MVHWPSLRRKYGILLSIAFILIIAFVVVAPTGYLSSGFFKKGASISKSAPQSTTAMPTQTTATPSAGTPLLSGLPTTKVVSIDNVQHDCIGEANDRICIPKIDMSKPAKDALLGGDCGNGKIEWGENYFTCPSDVSCVGKEKLGKCAELVVSKTLPNGRKFFLYADDYFASSSRKPVIKDAVEKHVDILYSTFIENIYDSTYVLVFQDPNAGGGYLIPFSPVGGVQYNHVVIMPSPPDIDFETRMLRHELTHVFQFSANQIVPKYMITAYIEGTATFFENLPSKWLNKDFYPTSGLKMVSELSYVDSLDIPYFYTDYGYGAATFWRVYYLANPNFFKELTNSIDKFRSGKTYSEVTQADPTPLLADISSKVPKAGWLGSVEHLSKLFGSRELIHAKQGASEGLSFDINIMSDSGGQLIVSANYIKPQPVGPVASRVNVNIRSFDGTINRNLAFTFPDTQGIVVPNLPRPQAGIATATAQLLDGSNKQVTVKKIWATDIYVEDSSGYPLNAVISLSPTAVSLDKNSFRDIKISNGVARLAMSQDLRDVELKLPSGETQIFKNVLIPSSYAVFTIKKGQTGTILVSYSGGSGPGTVTSSDGKINCGTDCSEKYLSGTTVTLTATPSSGFRFSSWSSTGGCAVSIAQNKLTCIVSAGQTMKPVAVFEKVETLSVFKSGTGSGTIASSPAGISCSSSCSASFSLGSLVILTATPNLGSTFAGWSGACTGTSYCKLFMDGTKSVTATFSASSGGGGGKPGPDPGFGVE